MDVGPLSSHQVRILAFHSSQFRQAEQEIAQLLDLGYLLRYVGTTPQPGGIDHLFVLLVKLERPTEISRYSARSHPNPGYIFEEDEMG